MKKEVSVHGEDFHCNVALVFTASVSAQAGEVSAEAKAGVTKALAEIGCTSHEIEAEGEGYEADDA